MNIMPIHPYTAKDRPWVIVWLRCLGYMIVIAATVAACVLLIPGFTVGIMHGMGVGHDFAATLALVLCALLGFLAGVVASVPLWGLAMLLDDIHAIRMQTAGYAALGGERNTP